MEDLEVLSKQTWIENFGLDNLNLGKLDEYLEFIKKCFEEDYSESDYTEWHHIIPKCLDEDERYRSQVVQLTASGHLQAHLYLLEIFKSNCTVRRRLGYAVHRMRFKPDKQGKLTPDEYEIARIAYSEAIRGTKMPEEVCKRISAILGDGRLKGEKHPRYGKHCSDETALKISEANKRAWTPEKKQEFSERRKGSGNPCYGRVVVRTVPCSEETRQKMSLSGRDKIWINNGKESTKISKHDDVPEGWVLGRLPFSRESNGLIGKIWIVNKEGCCTRVDPSDQIPEGFVRGKVWREPLEN